MRKKIVSGIVLLVLLGACAGGIYFFVQLRGSGDATGALPTAQVQRGTLAVNVRASGMLDARTRALLRFGAQGVVKNVFVQVGDRVQRGQVLAELDATALELALAQAQAAYNQQLLNLEETRARADAWELEAARAAVTAAQFAYDAALKKAGMKNDQVIVAQTALEKAQLALQKAQAAYDKAVSEQAGNQLELKEQLAQAKLDYTSAQANYRLQIAALEDAQVSNAASALASAQANLAKLENSPTPRALAQAQAQVEQARIGLAQAQLQLSNAQLLAPFDGTVTQVNLENYAATGSSAQTQGIEIADLAELQVAVNVPEVDVVKLKPGQTVKLAFDVLPDRNLNGVLERIGFTGATEQGITSFPVIIRVTELDPQLRLSMSANATILVEERAGVLLIPNRAVWRKEGVTYAQVKSPAGIKEVEIMVGLQGEGQSQVLSGLNEGDTVTLQPINVPSFGPDF